MNLFDMPFLWMAVAVGLFAGLALAWLGVFLSLGRVAFSGLALSQWVALGTVLGVSMGLHVGASVLAVCGAVGGLLLLARLNRGGKTSPELSVACLYVFGAAGAVLFLSKVPGGESETMGIFFGNMLSLRLPELLEALGLLLGVGTMLGIYFNRWLWVHVDPLSAEVGGIRVKLWNSYFHVASAVALTLGIHFFGVLLSFAYLVLPATLALGLARRVSHLFIGVSLATIGATLAGIFLSFRWDFPTGPLVAGLLAGGALAVRLVRGRQLPL